MLFVIFLFFTSFQLSCQQGDARGEVYDKALSLAKQYNSMRTRENIQQLFKIPYLSDYCDGNTYNLTVDEMLEMVQSMTAEDWKKCANEKISEAKYLDDQQVIEFTMIDDASRAKSVSYTFVAAKNDKGEFIMRSEKCQEMAN